MEQEKILEIAVRAGSILLQNGAETYRVEDTIKRICMSYGLECEPFALPTGVFVSVEGQKGFSTICKRITSRTIDLTKIARVNDLSRRIERNRPDYDEVSAELENINKDNFYSATVVTISFALTSFAYTLLFGGGMNDIIAAIAIGAFLGILRFVFSKGSSFPFIQYFISGFASSFLSSLAASLVPANAFVITIGAITNLVPGVALANGIRDLLHGDSVSGLARLGEAFMVVAVIAAGTGIGITLWLWGGSL